jgi:hypothetical protein
VNIPGFVKAAGVRTRGSGTGLAFLAEKDKFVLALSFDIEPEVFHEDDTSYGFYINPLQAQVAVMGTGTGGRSPTKISGGHRIRLGVLTAEQKEEWQKDADVSAAIVGFDIVRLPNQPVDNPRSYMVISLSEDCMAYIRKFVPLEEPAAGGETSEQ